MSPQVGHKWNILTRFSPVIYRRHVIFLQLDKSSIFFEFNASFYYKGLRNILGNKANIFLSGILAINPFVPTFILT